MHLGQCVSSFDSLSHFFLSSSSQFTPCSISHPFSHHHFSIHSPASSLPLSTCITSPLSPLTGQHRYIDHHNRSHNHEHDSCWCSCHGYCSQVQSSSHILFRQLSVPVFLLCVSLCVSMHVVCSLFSMKFECAHVHCAGMYAHSVRSCPPSHRHHDYVDLRRIVSLPFT